MSMYNWADLHADLVNAIKRGAIAAKSLPPDLSIKALSISRFCAGLDSGVLHEGLTPPAYA